MSYDYNKQNQNQEVPEVTESNGECTRIRQNLFDNSFYIMKAKICGFRSGVLSCGNSRSIAIEFRLSNVWAIRVGTVALFVFLLIILPVTIF